MNEMITIGQALCVGIIVMIPIIGYIVNLQRDVELLEETLDVYMNELNK